MIRTEEHTSKLVQQDRDHLWHAMAKFNEETAPLLAVSGDGAWFQAADGNRYMDGVSGLWCLNLGHGRKEIAQAVYDQLMNVSYFPLTMSHEPAVELAAKLSGLLGAPYTTFFTCSGSEANEAAFKIARQYHAQTGHPEKTKIISRYRAYHGSTLGALSATAQASRKLKYGAGAPGFLHLPPPYSYRPSFPDDIAAADHLEKVIEWEGADTIAAVIMEPFISGGGVLIPSPAYLRRVADICQKHKVLLIVDEVVSGFGRTGKMFGFMHSEGVQPDIVTMAKGLTAGCMPLGATAVRAHLYDAFKGTEGGAHFRHVSTFGGHPASCAAALKTIEILEGEHIPKRVAELSDEIMEELHELDSCPIVGEVRGIGFLYGIELVQGLHTKEPASEETMLAIAGACKAKGLIIGRNGDTVPGFQNILIIAPPLSSTEEDLRFLINTVKTAVKERSS